jgi:hypothetical protein
MLVLTVGEWRVGIVDMGKLYSSLATARRWIGVATLAHMRPILPRRAYARHFLGNLGAGEGIRTLDPNLGKVVLYP